MGLLDDIHKHNTGHHNGVQCTIRRILSTMTAEDSQVLKQALADPLIKGTAIRKALIANGYQVSDGVVTRHRRGECICGS